jgi:guanylate kinase
MWCTILGGKIKSATKKACESIINPKNKTSQKEGLRIHHQSKKQDIPKRRLANPSSIQKTRHAKKKTCESIINPKTKHAKKKAKESIIKQKDQSQ